MYPKLNHRLKNGPKMSKILVLGATGMLGSAVSKVFQESKHDVLCSSRDSDFTSSKDNSKNFYFDAHTSDLSELSSKLSADDYVINCIGVVKSQINEANIESRERAIFANAVFPHNLADVAHKVGFRVIQIATDCVYSGAKGSYSEIDQFDPSDLYGLTKRAGEVPSANFMHLRASIIGRETRSKRSLVEWVLSLQSNAKAEGFLDHYWNGLTTAAFARVCRGIVEFEGFKPGIQHLVPTGSVTKNELVNMIAKKYGRDDICFVPKETGLKIDRTLTTINTQLNLALWNSAGFTEPPHISEMISEL